MMRWRSAITAAGAAGPRPSPGGSELFINRSSERRTGGGQRRFALPSGIAPSCHKHAQSSPARGRWRRRRRRGRTARPPERRDTAPSVTPPPSRCACHLPLAGEDRNTPTGDRHDPLHPRRPCRPHARHDPARCRQARRGPEPSHATLMMKRGRSATAAGAAGPRPSPGWCSDVMTWPREHTGDGLNQACAPAGGYTLEAPPRRRPGPSHETLLMKRVAQQPWPAWLGPGLRRGGAPISGSASLKREKARRSCAERRAFSGPGMVGATGIEPVTPPV